MVVLTQVAHNSRLMTHRFGAKIRARRAELDLSQDQVAERAGLHRNTVGRIEKRAVTLEDIETKELIALAHALEWTVAELSGHAEGHSTATGTLTADALEAGEDLPKLLDAIREVIADDREEAARFKAFVQERRKFKAEMEAKADSRLGNAVGGGAKASGVTPKRK